MKLQSIELRVFGVLRKIADEQGFMRVRFQEGVEIRTARDLTRALELEVRKTHPGFESGVILESALADEEKIIGPDASLEKSVGLALLPPVCGG